MNDNHDLHDEHISRLYKLGDGTGPPPHLDMEIRQAAHAAVAHKKRGYLWPSLATAAVLVLSISLVLKVVNQQPLEEPLLEAIPASETVPTPEVRKQESEDKADREAFRAKRLRIAPVPRELRGETEGSAQTQPATAPAGALMYQDLEKGLKHEEDAGVARSSVGRRLDCGAVPLPEGGSEEEWVRQYRQAMEQGRLETARCLRQAYQARFGRKMPEAPE